MTSLAVAGFLLDLGHSLREAFFMLWETLWALVLGFTLSGVVQAFVSKEKMQAQMGNHRPLTVAKASIYGMVSSSCSYAASAMSKSIFAKGADFITAMAFMIASTNLVVELGLVLLVLLGWQFAAAEFVGGPIMIALLASVGGLVLTAPIIEAARKRLTASADDDGAPNVPGPASPSDGAPVDGGEGVQDSLRSKITTPAAWADASSYAVADVTMLRKELVIGYLVAGFLAVLVPNGWWNALFLHGHGFWTSLENALVGPLIAVISWVCSIGNVPLAAALWSGGISFGGVIAFVFADLIAMPLILIYAKFYGWRLTIRLVALFYVLMAIAGLVVELLFGAASLIPTSRPVEIAPAHFEWNYTAYLNLVFIIVGAAVWWLARNRARFGGGQGYAIDPVCGMQVRTSDAPATALVGRTRYSFCADRCRERFEADPDRFTADGAVHEAMEPLAVAIGLGRKPVQRSAAITEAIDPVCAMTVDPATAAARRVHQGAEVWFCSVRCAERFDADPGSFATPGSTMST